MKKMDILYLLLAVIILGVVLRERFLPKSVVGKSLDRTGVQLVVVTKENDCIDCLEKTVCSFEEVSKMLTAGPQPISSVLFFASKDGAHFDTQEINHMCTPPEHIIPCSYDQLYSDQRLPLLTPAFLLVRDGRILAQETVFVPTNIHNLALRFSETLANLEAMYPVKNSK